MIHVIRYSPFIPKKLTYLFFLFLGSTFCTPDTALSYNRQVLTMSEYRFVKLAQTSHDHFPILPWMPRPKTRRIPYAHRDPLNNLNSDLFANMPFFRVVSIDPHNSSAMLIRYFKQENLAYITGKIELPCEVDFEHVLDAQILIREMEKVILQNVYHSYVAERDTRKRDPKEKRDLFKFNLQSKDRKVDLDLSFNIHPELKFTDPTQMLFRAQMAIDSLCAHIGCFLLYGSWNPSPDNSPSVSTLSDTASFVSNYDADLDSDSDSMMPLQLGSDTSFTISSTSSMSSDSLLYEPIGPSFPDDIPPDMPHQHLVYGSAFFYRTVLALLEFKLDSLI